MINYIKKCLFMRDALNSSLYHIRYAYKDLEDLNMQPWYKFNPEYMPWYLKLLLYFYFVPFYCRLTRNSMIIDTDEHFVAELKIDEIKSFKRKIDKI